MNVALVTPAFRGRYKSIFLYLILFFPPRMKIFMSAVGQEGSLRNFMQYFSICILVTMKLQDIYNLSRCKKGNT